MGCLPHTVLPEADSRVTVGGLRKKNTKVKTKERLNALLTLALRKGDRTHLEAALGCTSSRRVPLRNGQRG
jgi:hypothetical protein